MGIRRMSKELEQAASAEESLFVPQEVDEEGVSLSRMQELLERIFAPDGILKHHFPDYDVREQQVSLARSILNSLYDGAHLLAEAGTGVGKSFAYLVAAAIWSLSSDEVVVISTHTLPLQRQLMEKDLPLVARVMRGAGLGSLTYEQAKGRGNYVCRRRLSNYLRRAQTGEVQHADVARRLWADLEKSASGDRLDFPYELPNELWLEIQGDSDDCHGSFSPYYDRCFIQQARRKLFHAHLVISNHALFFSDLALRLQEESGILPPYRRVIFDEAHHVEDVFSRFASRRLSMGSVEQFFRNLTLRRQTWMEEVLDEQDVQELRGFEERMSRHFRAAFDQVAQAIAPARGDRFAGSSHLLTEPLPLSFAALDQEADALDDYLKTTAMARAKDEVQRRGMEKVRRRGRELVQDLTFIAQCAGGQDWAHWIEGELAEGQGFGLLFGDSLHLVAQPICAASALRSQLFDQVPAVLLSATMTAENSFGYLAERLGLTDYREVIYPPPFDYQGQSLLVISQTAPPPGEPGGKYEEFLVSGLKRVLAKTQGRTLVLFTSFRSLQRVAEGLEPWLRENGLQPLVHEPGGERERLIQAFVQQPRAVLFGCDSFWEGIDLPGELLQCVVLTKIPFAHPGDPLVQARMRRVEAMGGNAFAEYMIPEAIIKLKQGFGRLIRRPTDKGCVVIMDSRILQKSYGRKFLRSLPAARRGGLQEISHYLLQ